MESDYEIEQEQLKQLERQKETAEKEKEEEVDVVQYFYYKFATKKIQNDGHHTVQLPVDVIYELANMCMCFINTIYYNLT